MASGEAYSRWAKSRFRRWLLEGTQKPQEGFYETEKEAHQTHSWWRVMCLTGVDYFSSLGYQPSIAALAAGVLSPIATLMLVILTLFGALPMYRRVAGESPHGDGSISMLERLLEGWTGKFVVLALLGFVATGFIITITLSAADAAQHVVENPLWPQNLHNALLITLSLVALLGAVFLKGFKEAIGIAVLLVVLYIGLSLLVVGAGFVQVLQNPALISDWFSSLRLQFPQLSQIVITTLLVFPSLALGLSGFETGVVVMPLVKGDPTDRPEKPMGRIRNSRKLLTGAALIMSVMLLTSSLSTTWVISPAAFFPETHAHAELRGDASTIDIPLKESGSVKYTYTVPRRTGSFSQTVSLGKQGEISLNVSISEKDGVRQVDVVKNAGAANGRALAYMAHKYLGNAFGTLYDISTILILWFAGASAMAGLLNIVPRYLPRYGMAPEWSRATRPLVIIYAGVCFLVTIIFNASVDRQAAAYATGVLVLMGSAAIAVTLSALHKNERLATFWFAVVSLVLIYTLVVNVSEHPSGLQIASLFILGVIVISVVSRVFRSTELRVEKVQIDSDATEIIHSLSSGEIRLIANHRDAGNAFEYNAKELDVRQRTHIPAKDPVAFLEISVPDASEFSDVLRVTGVEVGSHRVLRVQGTSVPNAIAAMLLNIRDTTGKVPHIYFEWGERSPILAALQFIILGVGDVPTMTHEVLRQAEPNAKQRPVVHVGG